MEATALRPTAMVRVVKVVAIVTGGVTSASARRTVSAAILWESGVSGRDHLVVFLELRGRELRRVAILLRSGEDHLVVFL